MSSDVQQEPDRTGGLTYADLRKPSETAGRAPSVVHTEPLLDYHEGVDAAYKGQDLAGEASGASESPQAGASATAAPSHEEAGGSVQHSTQEPASVATDSTAHEESPATPSSPAASAVTAAARQQSFNITTAGPATSSSCTGTAQLGSKPHVNSSSAEEGADQAGAGSAAEAHPTGKQTNAHAMGSSSSSSHGARSTAAAPANPTAAATPSTAISSNSTSTTDGARTLRRYPTTSAEVESYLKEQNMLGTEEPKRAADLQQQGSVLLALLAVGVLGAAAAAAAAWNWWQGRRQGVAAGQEGNPEDAAVQEQLQKARKAAAGANAVAADIDAFLDGIGDSIDEEDLPPARPRAAAAAPAATAQAPKAPAKAAGAAAADAAQEAAIKEQEEKARRAAAGARAVAADIDKFLDLDIDDDVDLDQLSPEELAALEDELAELEGLEA